MDIHIEAHSENTQNITQFLCVKAQLLPIHFTCHHCIGDLTVGIKLCQIWYRTPQLGVCKQVQLAWDYKLLQEHLQTLFLKVHYLYNFTLYHPPLKKLTNFEEVGVAFLPFLELGSTNSPSIGPYLETYLGEAFLLELIFLEGVFWVGGVCLELGSVGATLVPFAGV